MSKNKTFAFAMGLIAGVVGGLVAGVLYAPKSGEGIILHILLADNIISTSKQCKADISITLTHRLVLFTFEAGDCLFCVREMKKLQFLKAGDYMTTRSWPYWAWTSGPRASNPRAASWTGWRAASTSYWTIRGRARPWRPAGRCWGPWRSSTRWAWMWA